MTHLIEKKKIKREVANAEFENQFHNQDSYLIFNGTSGNEG